MALNDKMPGWTGAGYVCIVVPLMITSLDGEVVLTLAKTPFRHCMSHQK
jgi:hypothetical protein